MPEVEVNIVYDKIQEAFEDGYTTASLQGSSRSGKTYNAMAWLISLCLKRPETTVSVVRHTLPALKGSVLRDFVDILTRIGIYKPKSFNKSELIYAFENGSWVEFFSCDDEEKLRGRKREILFVNEGNKLKFIEWQQLRMRTTMFSIIDYNPSFSDDHWIVELNKDSRTYHFITTYKDNPFLEDRVVEEIESLKDKNKTLWQVYGLGLQSQIEGLIFPAIDEVEDIPTYMQHWRIGVDYGFSHDPTAIIEVAWCDNDLYINEIDYRTHMLTSDIISVLKGYSAYKIISESADPRMVEEIHRAGLDVHEVRKYGRKIDSLTKMLEFNIHITKDSENVIKEFKNYTYRQDKEGKWLNEPIDGYDHAIDAIRYVVMNEIMGGSKKPIDKARVARAVY